MIWYAEDTEGNIYTVGDYGDVMAAAEDAVGYIDAHIIKVWTEDTET
jgi:hypothetical protein